MFTLVANARFLCEPKAGFGLAYSLDDDKFYVFQLASPDARYGYGQFISIRDEQRASEVSWYQANAAYQRMTGRPLSKQGRDEALEEKKPEPAAEAAPIPESFSSPSVPVHDITTLVRKRPRHNRHSSVSFSVEELTARVMMSAVGIVCIGLSIWYTRTFFIRDSQLPPFIATLLSAVIAVFNAFALTASTFLLHHKKYIMAAIFIPIWLATLSFDVLTVTGSQSYRFQLSAIASERIQEAEEREDVRYTLLIDERDDAAAVLQILEADITQARVDRDALSSELNRLLLERSSYGSEDVPVQLTNNINRLQPQVTAARNRASNLTESRTSAVERLEKARQALLSYVGERQDASPVLESANVTVSFADWVHVIFPGVRLQFIQLILAVVPAFFIDIISPIAMSFGLTLVKDRIGVPNDR